MIYYPGFETQNTKWLKFALLYLEDLMPIIPYSGDQTLSDSFKKIQYESDLINIYRPNYKDGSKATLSAIQEVEEILKHPERFYYLFKDINITDSWKEKDQKQFLIYQDKYTSNFEDFCISNDIGRKVENGLLVARELGLIYMTILANYISEAKSIPAITDNSKMDKFSIFTRQSSDSTVNEISVAKKIVNISIPKSFESISLDSILKLRKQKAFKDKLDAFHTQINKNIEDLKNGDIDQNTIKSLTKSNPGLFSLIAELGVSLVPVAFTSWLLLNSQNPVANNLTDELFAIGTASTIDAVIKIRRWKYQNRTPKLAKKYLADLNALSQ